MCLARTWRFSAIYLPQVFNPNQEWNPFGNRPTVNLKGRINLLCCSKVAKSNVDHPINCIFRSMFIWIQTRLVHNFKIHLKTPRLTNQPTNQFKKTLKKQQQQQPQIKPCVFHPDIRTLSITYFKAWTDLHHAISSRVQEWMSRNEEFLPLCSSNRACPKTFKKTCSNPGYSWAHQACGCCGVKELWLLRCGRKSVAAQGLYSPTVWLRRAI